MWVAPARLRALLAFLPAIVLAVAAPAHAVTRTGVLQIAHGHEAGSWRSTHVARLDGVRLDLRRAGDPGALAHRFGGRRVRVTGTMRGGVLRARALRRAPGSASKARAAHALSGAKTTLAVLFDFSGGPATTRTAGQLRTAFFTGATSLRAYIEEISGGAATITGMAGNSDGDVLGPVTITPDAGKAPSDGVCEEFHWLDKVDAAVRALGTDVHRYDRVMYVSADAAPCDFAGEAPVSSWPLGKGTWIYLNDSLSTRVAAHEWGHTYGLMHAASTRCTSGGVKVAISSSCTDSEYGDPFDTMGMGSARWFQAFNRVSLGMLPAATGTLTTSSAGLHTIGALSQSETGVRLMRVPRGDGSYLGLELRRTYGLFETWSSTAPVVKGVTVRILPGTYNCCDEPLTRLVDAHPGTTTFDDAPLAVGESLTDPVSGATISVVSVGGDVATVALSRPGTGEPGLDPAPEPDPAGVTPPAPPAPPATTPTPPPTTAIPPPAPDASTAVDEVAKPAALRVALVRRASRSVQVRVRPGIAGPWTIRATIRRNGRSLASRTMRNVRAAATTLLLSSRSKLRWATLTVSVSSAAGRQTLRRRV